MHEVFKALADPTRLRIVNMLAKHGELCVCKIVERLGMGQPAVSHHLGKLRQTGLLRARRQGQWMYYSLDTRVLRAGPLAMLDRIVSAAEDEAKAPTDSDTCEPVNRGFIR